jgi:flagellar basal body P-ring formation protein FlgA
VPCGGKWPRAGLRGLSALELRDAAHRRGTLLPPCGEPAPGIAVTFLIGSPGAELELVDGMRLASLKLMNQSLKLRACFLALLATSLGVGADSGNQQSVAELQRYAETFLMQRLQGPAESETTPVATAGNIDPRLRLQGCTSALQGIMPAAATVSARMTIGVRCASPAWTVYVPMTVETELKVLVMRAAAARNSSPTEVDVELQQRRVPGIATHYLTRADQLRGRHLKVAVSPGTLLTTDLLTADVLIKRGQRVTLVVNAGGIEVHAQGEAIADATATGRVRVLNLSSRKVVEGQAESSDRVRVSL